LERFEAYISNLSPLEFDILEELCQEFDIILTNPTTCFKDSSSPIRFNKHDKRETVTRVLLVSNDLNSIKFIKYLIKHRRDSIECLESNLGYEIPTI